MSTKNYIAGSTTGTFAAGDDSRFSQITSNMTSVNKLTLNPTSVKTSAYTANIQDFVLCDASLASITITLPTSPIDSSLVTIMKIDASSNTININIATGGSDTYLISGGTSASLALQGHAVTLRYQLSTGRWFETVVYCHLPQLMRDI